MLAQPSSGDLSEASENTNGEAQPAEQAVGNAPKTRRAARTAPAKQELAQADFVVEGPEYGPPPPPVAGAPAPSGVPVAGASVTPGASVTSGAPVAGASVTPGASVTSGAPVASARATPSAPVVAASPKTKAPALVQKSHEAVEVRVRDVLVLKLKLADGGLLPKERAARATRAIEAALVASSMDPVRTELRQDRAILFIGARPVVELTREDAEVLGEGSLELYAASAAAKIRDLLESESRRSVIASTLLDVVGVGALAVLLLYVLRMLGVGAQKAQRFVHLHPERVPAIRLRSIEVVGPAVLRSGLVVGVGVTKFLLQFALVYTYLIFSSSLFEATRGFGQRLSALLLEPLAGLMTRLAALLPLVLVTVIAVIVLVVLWRFIELFFAGVERRETELRWLKPELARPTSLLIRVGLVLSSLLFLAPVVTGNPEGALARLGMLVVVTCALGATPLLASGAVGLLTLYGLRLAEGERLRVGQGEQAVSGRVKSVGFFEILLDSDDGREIRVSHLLTLVRPVAVSSDKVLAAILSVEAEVPPQRLLELLEGLAVVLQLTAELRLVRLAGERSVAEMAFAETCQVDQRALMVALGAAFSKAEATLVLAEWRQVT